MYKKLICFFLALVFSSNCAYASIFLEPFIGYGLGSNITINNYSNNDGSSIDNGAYSGGTGIGFGARAGYEILGFFAGINFLHRNFNFSNESFSSSVDSTINEIGIIGGYQSPYRIKAYIGSNFSSTGIMQHRSGKLEMNDGGSTFFGVGIKAFTNLDFNLEYNKGYFNEQVNGILVSGKKTNYDYFFLSMSFPIKI